jgi:DNA primase
MTNSPIDEIKNRLDIVEVIGSYIRLQKAGANYKALCPFHSEKNPSFFVSPARQIWHCFGCGAGSSIFDFVMKIEGVEFGDALRILAQKAGVELKPMKPELKTERQRLYEICEWATRFFEKQLEASKTGQEAKKYLLNRGIDKESIKKWQIGYAPDVWQGLSDFLNSRGYKKEEIEKAGLAIKNEEGRYYDRFRGRIIFPIFDLNSQVIGFGGRVFKGALSENKNLTAKYINTPNTLIYDKSKILYGLDKAKLEIRKKNFCLLVEGYTDVILAHQAGIENTVSLSGTALTNYQLSILKRYTDNLFLAFDMDIAGDTATKRGIDLAQLQGFNIKIIVLPEGKDPADLLSEGREEFKRLIEKALSIFDFYFQNAFSQYDRKTAEGKRKISEILLPLIKRIPNEIEKFHWIQELAKKLEVGEKEIVEELNKVKLEERIYFSESEDNLKIEKPKSRKEILEDKLITLILKKPENLNLISDSQIDYLSPIGKEILINLKENLKFPIEKLSCQQKKNLTI